jgi:D-alanyl-lipoteichoic acid acyltransferase DltB (MBOAT superfamily)
MMPTAIEFWLFLPVLFAVHWLAPRRATVQNAILLVASYAFYASWSVRLLPVIVVATAVDYSIALFIDARRDRPGAMRAALAISLVYNVLQLGYFKYAGWLFGATIALPIGISFWTMSKVGYVLDVYYGRIAACRSPLTFATYVAFFPQLIAGPIVRADMLEQYAAPRVLSTDRLREGALAFLVGYVLKAMVADWLALAIVDPAWPQASGYSTLGHWVLLALYAIQIFGDFAGYSLLAIGTGRLFGLELPVNFEYPFISTTMVEFWRRWHISLNRWLFDYIYGPLTTGEGWFRGRLRAAFILVLLLSGVWHGARSTFAVWGLVHGVALAIWQTYDVAYRKACRRDRAWVARRKQAFYVATAWLVTQGFFLVTLSIFRSSSLAEAGDFVQALFIPRGGVVLPDYHIVPVRALPLTGCVGFVVAYHLFELGQGRVVRARLLAAPPVVRGVAYGLVIVLLLLFMPIAASGFVYGAF